ncbi:MAG: ABC transporter substrate-binding protein [Chloroflexota bacterium]
MTGNYSRRRFLIASASIAAVPLLAACSTPQAAPSAPQATAASTAAPAAKPAATQAPAAAKPLQKLSARLCWLKNGEFAALINASVEGYYEAEGFDLDLRQGGAGIDPLPLVAGKSEEFGVVAGSGQLIAAVVNGKMPLKFIGALMQTSPSGFMYLLKDGEQPNKRTPKDWKGAKLGIQAESLIATRIIASMNGLAEKDYEIVVSGTGPEQLLAGQVDYFNGWSNNQAWVLEKAGKKWGFINSTDYIPHYADLLFARQDYLEANPELAKKFVRATMKGLQFGLDNPQKTAENVVKLGEKQDLAQNVWRMGIQNQMVVSEASKKNGLGWMDPERIKKISQIMYDTTEGTGADARRQLSRIPEPSELMTNDYLPGKA